MRIEHLINGHLYDMIQISIFSLEGLFSFVITIIQNGI